MSLLLRQLFLLIGIFFTLSLYANDQVHFQCEESSGSCLTQLATLCQWSVDHAMSLDLSFTFKKSYKNCREVYQWLQERVPGIFLVKNVLTMQHNATEEIVYSPEFLSVHVIQKQLKRWLSSAMMKKIAFFDISSLIFVPPDKVDVVKTLDIPPKQIHIQALLWIADVQHRKDIGIKPHILSSNSLEEMRNHLHMMESYGDVQVLAEPQLYLGVAHKAVVSSGEEIPYQIAHSKNPRISFKKALLVLAVKAQHIGADGATVDIEVSFDKPSEHSYHGNVAIARQTVKTSLRLPFNKPVVMGGVYVQRASVQKNCLPVIGHIPIVGDFLCYNASVDKKSSLYVMLSAKKVA